MEDKHFIAQNGLNGAVVFLFASGTWLLLDGDEAVDLFQLIASLGAISSIVTGLFAVVLAPIIGFLVQGLALALPYLGSGPYVDESRRIVSSRVRKNIADHRGISSHIKAAVCRMRDDEVFVAVYYREAPEQLIEWARRRRDSQHLGENWAVAAICGVLVAFSVFSVQSMTDDNQKWVIIKFVGAAVFLLWTVGFMFMRYHMKREADGLELVWALTHLYPEVYDLSTPPPESRS